MKEVFCNHNKILGTTVAAATTTSSTAPKIDLMGECHVSHVKQIGLSQFNAFGQ